MSSRIFVRLIFCLALLIFGCSKDVPVSTELTQSEQGSVLGKAGGATQISGVSFFAGTGECENPPPDEVPTFALSMTGDLVGCHYVTVLTAECSPSGTYRETGTETFVGTYNGKTGSFKTTYKFEAKYQDCENIPEGEIFGRCQHPIVKGSGTGDFEGVTGRLDFKDNIEAGNFPYRGHLRF